jgi:hypothetical protein
MSSVLKGNFKTAKTVAAKTKSEDQEDVFEREAKKRLGGSIAFVSKKKVLWDADEQDDSDA